MIVTLNGVVRKTKSGKKFINDPKDQELILEIYEVLKKAKERGYTIVGISNEGGVEFGHKTLDSCVKEQRYTLELAEGLLDAIYFAPYTHSGCAVYNNKLGYSQFFRHGFEYVKRNKTLMCTTEDTYIIQHDSKVFRLPDTSLWVAMAIDFGFIQPILYSRQYSINPPEKVVTITLRCDYLFAHKLGFENFDAYRWLPKENQNLKAG